MQQAHHKLDTIFLIDGIAVFLIVLYHVNDLYPFLGFMGMALFTFSSGYKLIINHSYELDQRVFLSTYYIKRFVRLYKAYIGYTLLMVFPVLLTVFFAAHFFHFVPPPTTRPFWFLIAGAPGISFFTVIFNNISIAGILNFLCGDNIIVGQLWFLVALIGITSICFTILYFLNIKWLFLSFIPFFLISLMIKFGIIPSLPFIVSNIFMLLPFFIFGCYWAFNQQQYQTVTWVNFTRFSFPVIFLILICSSILSQKLVDGSILIYSCYFLFPLFLLSIFDYVKKIKFLYPSLMFCGAYSFQIYLFHEPLILPILSRIINGILNFNYLFTPLLIAIIAIYCCVIVYKFVKSVHLNRLFE